MAKYTPQGADIDSPDLKGLIPRITEQIFQSIVESDAHLEYLVKVSYMEIYLERIRDLLARESCSGCTAIPVVESYLSTAQNDNLQVHEEKSKGVYVKNLSDYYVSSAREVYEIMRQGGAARVVSYTSTSYITHCNGQCTNSCRHECGEFSITLHLPDHYQPEEYGDRCTEDW